MSMECGQNSIHLDTKVYTFTRSKQARSRENGYIPLSTPPLKIKKCVLDGCLAPFIGLNQSTDRDDALRMMAMSIKETPL